MTTGNNQFLPFATGLSANVLTAAEYEALTALVANGFQSGIAQSQQVNTPIRQGTFVAAAMAQIIANSGVDANDDGNIANFVTNFINALGKFFLFPGSVQWFAMQTAPSGFLTAYGSAISRSAYLNLFSAIGTTYGVGDGSTTFNIPDLRGAFIRGWDNGKGLDPSRVFGSLQNSALGLHNHSASVSDPGHAHSVYDPGHAHGVYDPGHDHYSYGVPGTGQGAGGGVNSVQQSAGAQPTTYAGTGIGIYGAGTNVSIYNNNTGITVSVGSAGSSETRPINISLLPCIKF